MSAKTTGWLPVVCLVTAMVLWASSFIALKIAFRAYSPMIVIWGRMLVGSFCFLFLLPRLRQVRIRRRDLPRLAAPDNVRQGMVRVLDPGRLR